MTASGPHTYYETLNVSPEASREDIELACLGLWYKYKIMRTTPLWAELNRQIEQIHATLSNPQSRAAYDWHLQNPGSERPLPPDKNGEDTTPPVARLPAVKFRKVCSFNATGGALLFNGLINHIRPQEWSDLSTIGGLALFFSLAATFLIWSVANLFPAKPAGETIVDPRHAT